VKDKLRLLALLAVGFSLYTSDAGASCVTLTWTASGDDGYSGQATEYDLRVSTSPLTDITWDRAQSYHHVHTPSRAGDVETVVVSGLEPGRTYFFALKVADEEDNWSNMSNVVVREAPPDTCRGIMGDVDCDEFVDITDILLLARMTMLGGVVPCCMSEANLDGDAAGIIDMSDILWMANGIFTGTSTLPPCPD
jgi:hypothetical protein